MCPSAKLHHLVDPLYIARNDLADNNYDVLSTNTDNNLMIVFLLLVGAFTSMLTAL